MTPKSSLENQRRFIAEKKAQGLKRLTLWVKPEDVEAHQLAAQQPHALNRLSKAVEAEIERQMWDRVTKVNYRLGSVYKSYAWICDRGGEASAG